MELLDTVYKTTVILTFAGASLLLLLKGGRIFDGIRSLIAIAPQLREIVKEFKPNSGSSLKDQINRLESAHKVIDSDNKKQLLLVNEVKEDLAAVKQDVAKLSGRLESTK